MYAVKYRPHKKWKLARFKRTMPGVKNGLVRSKRRAKFLAANIKEATGHPTKVEKA